MSNVPQEEPSASQWLRNTGRLWSLLAAGAAWIFAVIGGFLLPPPIGTSKEDQRIWPQLAAFIVTVLAGLMFVAGRRWNKRKHSGWWAIISAALLVLAIGSLLGYQSLSYSRTCKYNNRTVVIGTVYTQQALRFLENHPGRSSEYLVNAAAGKVEDVWTKESIDRARIQLAVTYISCIPLFALCIIAVIQSIYIHETAAKRPRSLRNKKVQAEAPRGE